MRVRHLTTPSMHALLPMWGRHFGFMRLTVAEWAALEERCGNHEILEQISVACLSCFVPHPRAA